MDDHELLRRYAEDRLEAAFTELVQRHLNLVYSAGLRLLNGNGQLAEEVAQEVFTDLARHAPRLRRHTSIIGWLYTSTRYAAAKARRAEQRRRVREQHASAMNSTLQSFNAKSDWEQLRPVLDDAMHELGHSDRNAILLRYFEGQPHAQIGRKLGVSEEAARVRIARALEKLRKVLLQRGIVSSSPALAALLTEHAITAAPSGLAAKLAQVSWHSVAGAKGLFGALQPAFQHVRWQVAAGALVVTCVLMPLVWWGQDPELASDPAPGQAVLSMQSDPTDLVTPAASGATLESLQNSDAAAAALASSESAQAVLRLAIVAADSGAPIPTVRVDLRSWEGAKFVGKQLLSGRDGLLEVELSPELTDLQLTTRVEGFADTQLHWIPKNGHIIPAEYTARLVRAVPIGGTVVDSDGYPISGAKVGFNHEEVPALQSYPQDHQFGWIEVSTDDQGRWRINRIAPDMLDRIHGNARHSEYINSPVLFAARDPEALERLRAEKHVFTLGRAVTVTGTVVDPNHRPVSGAKILVGRVGSSARREATAQVHGQFRVSGCEPGRNFITAEAPGYAPTTERVELAPDMPPVRLVLRPGQTLRMQVVNPEGRPVSGANVWLDTFADLIGNSIRVQTEFHRKTDEEGRVVWPNAPECELVFQFGASGYMRLNDVQLGPSNQEHQVTLSRALVVAGTVTDADSGESIPKFRMITGWPTTNHHTGLVLPRWSSLERFWIPFADGAFRHAYKEPVISGRENPGYMLKFEAEGYAPFISRTIAPDEGEVRLDVKLHPAVPVRVTVLTPDSQPAANAIAGLCELGQQLSIASASFSRKHRGSIWQTDNNGQVNLVPEEFLAGLVVVHPSGIAQLSSNELRDGTTVQLLPWGRLEARAFSVGQPVSGMRYRLIYQASQPMYALDPMTYSTETDAEGRFAFPHVPPGEFRLIRMARKPTVTRPSLHPLPQNTEAGPLVEIRPGETTTIHLQHEGAHAQ